MAAAGRSREERWSLAGTTALATGGSRGIGHAIVEELVGFGARVHTCSENAVEVEECRLRWEEKKLPVTVSVCDVSVCSEREKLMETIKLAFDGKLDILLVRDVGQPLKEIFKWANRVNSFTHSQDEVELLNWISAKALFT